MVSYCRWKTSQASDATRIHHEADEVKDIDCSWDYTNVCAILGYS